MTTSMLQIYRCYFYGRDGHIKERLEYEATTDELAVVEARALYAESRFGAGFEVWQLARLVHRANP